MSSIFIRSPNKINTTRKKDDFNDNLVVDDETHVQNIPYKKDDVHEDSYIDDEIEVEEVTETLSKVPGPKLQIVSGKKLSQASVVVFMDIAIERRTVGKLLIKLRKDVVPKTAQNFLSLATGERGYGYKNSKFYRIFKEQMCIGGDFRMNNGQGGMSIYGPKFPDENFELTHSERGVIAMYNKGPNTNSSIFYITFKPMPELDGKNVVFGQVVGGFDVLDKLDEVGTNSGEPTKEVVIKNCGQWKRKMEAFLIFLRE